MDNTNKNNQQSPTQNQTNNPAQLQGQQQRPVSQQQKASVGSVHKEQEPVKPADEPVVREKSDHVEVSKEAESVGIRVHQDQIKVAKELQNIGVYETGTSAKVSANPTVRLPIPDNEVEKGLHNKIYLSVRWLAEWCILQLKRAHLTLKVVHGKVMRVPYRKE